jgi:hypothetical protein
MATTIAFDHMMQTGDQQGSNDRNRDDEIADDRCHDAESTRRTTR